MRKALYVSLLFPLVASEGQQALLIAAILKTVGVFAAAVWLMHKLGWVVRDPAAQRTP